MPHLSPPTSICLPQSLSFCGGPVDKFSLHVLEPIKVESLDREGAMDTHWINGYTRTNKWGWRCVLSFDGSSAAACSLHMHA